VFGKRLAHSKLRSLSTDVSFVLSGLKPSYLFDQCQVTKGQCEQLIARLASIDPLQTLRILVIDDVDTLVINETRLVAILDDFRVETVFVDVDIGHNSPVALTHSEHLLTISKMTDHVSSRIKSSSHPVLAIEVERDWNLATLFGILLNYPAVYWFPPDRQIAGNTDVVVVRVTLKDGDHAIYQFSYPECMHSDLQHKVKNWLSKLPNEHLLVIKFEIVRGRSLTL